jgi:hypothetical protein
MTNDLGSVFNFSLAGQRGLLALRIRQRAGYLPGGGPQRTRVEDTPYVSGARDVFRASSEAWVRRSSWSFMIESSSYMACSRAK